MSPDTHAQPRSRPHRVTDSLAADGGLLIEVDGPDSVSSGHGHDDGAADMGTDEKQEANENGMDMGFLGILEPTPEDSVSGLLLQQLGLSGRSYRREHPSSCRRIVSEMYSPPRVTAEPKRMNNTQLLSGFALDLTAVDPDDSLSWDFSKSGKRGKNTRCEGGKHHTCS